ncbi:Bicoid-interacting protein 3-domain-containing protein [Chlamydoabsidia padenii]|nr:Bicoid-interacting protein 3-domain-containing protein [Chlamydoabsidia padenii]
MTDQPDKRPNPYLMYSQPITKRPNISLKSTKEQHTTSTGYNDRPINLGSGTGIHFPLATREKKASTKSQGRNKYGNYTGYYEARRNTSIDYDPRLAVLDASLFKNKIVLDIGCNSGNLTIALAQHCQPKHILGIDIDESLITKAKSLQKTVYSLQQPKQSNKLDLATPLTTTLDIRLQVHYFPKSMAVMFGHIPMAVPPTLKPDGFPWNLSFEAGDWMEMDTEKGQYDTILALSITKWIHLHRTDEGLKDFFYKIHQSLKKQGVLVLEPQPFTSYERRAKQSQEMAEIFSRITFMPEHFHDYLMNDLGFSSCKQFEVNDAESKGFTRPIYLYTK